MQQLDDIHRYSVPERIESYGFGHGGFDGVSFMPLTRPLRLPSYLTKKIDRLAKATFAFIEAVSECYEDDPWVRAKLEYRVPNSIPRYRSQQPLSFARPDITLVWGDDGRLEPKITEIETAPGSIGNLIALHAVYGHEKSVFDLLSSVVGDRELVIVMTHEWAEYLWDLSIACDALRRNGQRARIIIDQPLDAFARYCASIWQPTGAADTEAIRAQWNEDVLGRMRRNGFDAFIEGSEQPPQLSSDALVFRFGYFDNFTRAWLSAFRQWEEGGVQFLNPTTFFLESKALLSLTQHPSVRERMQHRTKYDVLGTIDRGIAPTYLLGETTPDLDLFRDRRQLVLKDAAYTHQNINWGARSVTFGQDLTGARWQRALNGILEKPYPVVAQEQQPSALLRAQAYDADGGIQELSRQRLRLSPFFWRRRDGIGEFGGLFATLTTSRLVHTGSNAGVATVELVRDGETDLERSD